MYGTKPQKNKANETGSGLYHGFSRRNTEKTTAGRLECLKWRRPGGIIVAEAFHPDGI
jgi:hypothetical protein